MIDRERANFVQSQAKNAGIFLHPGTGPGRYGLPKVFGILRNTGENLSLVAD